MFENLKQRAVRSEDGWVLVTAIVVMSLMLGVGIAILKIVDTQQQQSNFQRVREASFNLSEGMLYQESQILSRRWPDAATTAFPSSCAQNNYDAAHVNFCTDPASV